MTKEEFFKEHQNNEDLIKELDEVINVLKDCGNPIPYFGIHMKQLKLDLYLYGVYKDEKISNRHNYLLAILVDLKIVDKFQSSSNDENSTYKIKSSAVLSESLLEQFIQWKTEQKHKNTPNIVENYTNSNVIKGSSFQESQLQFESENAKQSKTTHTNHPNANEPNEIIEFIKKFWWAIIIPILLLIVEHKWIAKLFNGE